MAFAIFRCSTADFGLGMGVLPLRAHSEAAFHERADRPSKIKIGMTSG